MDFILNERVNLKPYLVVFNSCNSKLLVERVNDSAKIASVGTGLKPDKEEVVLFVNQFYRSIANGNSLENAVALGNQAIGPRENLGDIFLHCGLLPETFSNKLSTGEPWHEKVETLKKDHEEFFQALISSNKVRLFKPYLIISIVPRHPRKISIMNDDLSKILVTSDVNSDHISLEYVKNGSRDKHREGEYFHVSRNSGVIRCTQNVMTISTLHE